MAQFDFLTEYVAELLNQNGLGGLTDEQKKVYIPQLLGKVEERIGLALLPKLTAEQFAVFAKLVDNKKTSDKEWQKFWQGAIPDFENEIKKILTSFAQEVATILAI